MDHRNKEHVLLVFFCFLIVVPVLYICRGADTNTFTSWKWVFSPGGLSRTFLLLIPALIAAYLLSRMPLPGPARLLFIFVVSLVSVIPLWSEPESIIDASRYFVQAKSLEEYGIPFFLKEWGRGIDAWTDLPLVPFCYGLVFTIFGESRLLIEALNTVLFALTALLTCLIGERIWDEETGMNAGLLLLGIPFLLTQAPLLLVDVPAMFFFTLSIYSVLTFLEKGGAVRAAVSAGTIVLSFLTKYSLWPMLLIIPMMPLLIGNKDRKAAIKRMAVVLLFAGLLISGAAVFLADVLRQQAALLRRYQWSGLARWKEGYLSTFLFQTHPFITTLALGGTLEAARKKDARFLIAAWSLFLIVPLRITRIRYIIPVFPLFVLMASYGLNLFRDPGARRVIALCIAASSLVIVYSAYLPYLRTTSMANLQHAGEYLNHLDISHAEVHALPQMHSTGSTFAAIPLLDYYSGKEIVSPQKWPVLPADTAGTSSMLFTWEMKKPAFYAGQGSRGKHVVVLISDQPPSGLPAPPGTGELIRFDQASDVFRYRTIVTVYGNE